MLRHVPHKYTQKLCNAFELEIVEYAKSTLILLISTLGTSGEFA